MMGFSTLDDITLMSRTGWALRGLDRVTVLDDDVWGVFAWEFMRTVYNWASSQFSA